MRIQEHRCTMLNHYHPHPFVLPFTCSRLKISRKVLLTCTACVYTPIRGVAQSIRHGFCFCRNMCRTSTGNLQKFTPMKYTAIPTKVGNLGNLGLIHVHSGNRLVWGRVLR